MVAEKENINGVYLLKCLECSDFGKCASCVHKYKVFERLSEYEALGITPEQVKEMDELYKKKCEEVARLENEKEMFLNLVKTLKEEMNKILGALWRSI